MVHFFYLALNRQVGTVCYGVKGAPPAAGQIIILGGFVLGKHGF